MLKHFLRSSQAGVEFIDNYKELGQLMKRMLSPHAIGKADALPSGEKAAHLEECFPKLFPRGRGGPSSIHTKISLQARVKRVISAIESRLALDIDFLYFVNAALRRRKLHNLSAHAPAAKSAVKMLREVRRSASKERNSDLNGSIRKIKHIISSYKGSAFILEKDAERSMVLSRCFWRLSAFHDHIRS